MWVCTTTSPAGGERGGGGQGWQERKKGTGGQSMGLTHRVSPSYIIHTLCHTSDNSIAQGALHPWHKFHTYSPPPHTCVHSVQHLERRPHHRREPHVICDVHTSASETTMYRLLLRGR